MSSKTTVTISNLDYTDLLATFPWVSREPNFQAPQCESYAHWHRGRVKTCKALGVLRYIDLDGSVHHFCHHHLWQARMSKDHLDPMDALWVEVERNAKWQAKHVTFPKPELEAESA